MRGRERGISKIEAKHGKTDLVRALAASISPARRAAGEPTKQWHGGGVRTDPEARLRPGLPRPRRRDRAPQPCRLADALQRPPSLARLSFAARVHPSINPRGPVRELRGNNAATQSSFC